MKKCDQCQKKVGLLGFDCKCGKTLCAAHRYPETHGCDAKVDAIKLDKIVADKLKDRLT
jgi:hypothetical protein